MTEIVAEEKRRGYFGRELGADEQLFVKEQVGVNAPGAKL